RVDPQRPELDEVTFGAWLSRHGQRAEAIAALWDLIALPTLNLPAEQASLALAAFVFRTGLLSAADAGDIGFHAATLERTIGEPAARALRAAGVEVRLGRRAERIVPAGEEIEVHARAGRGEGEEGELEGQAARAVVLAVPHARAARLLEPLAPEAAARLRSLESSPIVHLHVPYARQVCEHPFAAGVGTPVQYLFDRSAPAGAPAGHQYLAVSLSGADREMEMSVPALRERYEPALRELLPRARQARLEGFLVTREHAATFRAAPGSGALRLGARSGVPGLSLAGAWTATGWPATLEGAVLSGHTAAALALQRLGIAPRAAREPAPELTAGVGSAGVGDP